MKTRNMSLGLRKRRAAMNEWVMMVNKATSKYRDNVMTSKSY